MTGAQDSHAPGHRILCVMEGQNESVALCGDLKYRIRHCQRYAAGPSPDQLGHRMRFQGQDRDVCMPAGRVVCRDITSGELVDNKSLERALGEQRQVLTS